MTENKPCPFCGKRLVFIDTLHCASGKPGKFRAQCQECFVATKWNGNREQAWADWNRRAEPPKRPCGRPRKAAGQGGRQNDR